MAVLAQGMRDDKTFMGEDHCLVAYLWDLITHGLVEKGWLRETQAHVSDL